MQQIKNTILGNIPLLHITNDRNALGVESAKKSEQFYQTGL